jgi:phospholipid/cholesterol/gamma-HCH transport system ATP-binding protein
MTVPLIQFNQVFKRFGDNAVLKGVDLSIYRGEVTAIIGKSGIGKSVCSSTSSAYWSPTRGKSCSKGRR